MSTHPGRPVTGSRRCKDCPPDRPQRPAPHPGPRCYTHHRAKRRADAHRAHARRVENTYGISGDDYGRLHAPQGGRCAICQRATGKPRRLAVDHNHQTGQVRGLLCSPCNFELLGRYDQAALQRALDYLTDPPAPHILNRQGNPQ